MSIDASAIQAILAVTMALSVVGYFWNRIVTGKSIGIRATQFMTVVLIIPAIVILAIGDIISSAVLGTLFGALIGYVLSNMARDK